ncbi:MAG: hypothetical protein ABIO82_07945 [Ginsengibacter sp.]
MKNIILGLIVFAFFSCNTSEKSLDMKGAYIMQSQTLNDGAKDAKLTGLKQLKIYTDEFFMYSQVNPGDSVSAFGVGSYSVESGKVVEDVIYSASSSRVGSPNVYRLDIQKNSDGYTQVIPEIMIDSVKNKLTEEYRRVGTDQTSPLDGVWKETKSYKVTPGNDTLMNQRTQYKTFYRGYFMFGHTFKDSASNTHTGIGFGTFEPKSESLITETDLNSTYSIIAGKSFDVTIEMDGTDNFKQMLENADGTTGVEFYERLKK